MTVPYQSPDDYTVYFPFGVAVTTVIARAAFAAVHMKAAANLGEWSKTVRYEPITNLGASLGCLQTA